MNIRAELRFESKTSHHRKKLFVVQLYVRVCDFGEVSIHVKPGLLHDSSRTANEDKVPRGGSPHNWRNVISSAIRIIWVHYFVVISKQSSGHIAIISADPTLRFASRQRFPLSLKSLKNLKNYFDQSIKSYHNANMAHMSLPRRAAARDRGIASRFQAPGKISQTEFCRKSYLFITQRNKPNRKMEMGMYIGINGQITRD
jgi:hypothetical protein